MENPFEFLDNLDFYNETMPWHVSGSTDDVYSEEQVIWMLEKYESLRIGSLKAIDILMKRFHVGMKGVYCISDSKLLDVEISRVTNNAVTYIVLGSNFNAKTGVSKRDNLLNFDSSFTPKGNTPIQVVETVTPIEEVSVDSTCKEDLQAQEEIFDEIPEPLTDLSATEAPLADVCEIDIFEGINVTKSQDQSEIEENELVIEFLMTDDSKRIEALERQKKSSDEMDEILGLDSEKSASLEDELLTNADSISDKADKLLVKTDNINEKLEQAIENDKSISHPQWQDEAVVITKPTSVETSEEVIIDEPLSEVEMLEQELQQDIADGLLSEEIAQDVIIAVKSVEQAPIVQEERQVPEPKDMHPFMKTNESKTDIAIERNNSDFYINEKRCLMIVNYKEEILLNLPTLTGIILTSNYNQSDFHESRVTIAKKVIEETNEVEIHHIIYMTKFGVRFVMTLEEVYDYLIKIDFEPQEEPTTLF